MLGGLQPEVFVVEAGQVLVALQKGWRVDDVLHFLAAQRGIYKVHWRGEELTPRQLQAYLARRAADHRPPATAHRRKQRRQARADTAKW